MGSDKSRATAIGASDKITATTLTTNREFWPDSAIAQAVSAKPFLVSVSNRSKSAVQFRVQVGTQLELLQWIVPHKTTEPHRTRGFLAGSTISLTQNLGCN